MRTIIIGGPRSGKSTLANTFGVPVFCADPVSLVKDKLDNVTYLPDSVTWDNQSHFICQNWFKIRGDWVIEGVGVVRALRKWIKYYDTAPPCYNIIYIKDKHPLAIELLDGQVAMTKGIESVWNEIYNFYEPITQYKYWSNFKTQERTKDYKAEETKYTFRMFKG